MFCGLTQENDEENFEGNEGQGDELDDDDDDDSDDDGTLQGKFVPSTLHWKNLKMQFYFCGQAYRSH